MAPFFLALVDHPQSVFQVGFQVPDVFEANAQPDQIVGNANLPPRLFTQYAVRGGRRVGDERFAVAEVVRDTDETQGVQYLEGIGLSSCHLEGHERTTVSHLS